MATNAEVTTELQRAANNVRNLTTALLSERKERDEDNQMNQATINQNKTRIEELEGQVQTLTGERDVAKGEKDEQAVAVTAGSAELAEASTEAEKALESESSGSSES